jgi:XRE family aerobic/anaerobic benzoate catabolism transcriptional regulator
MFASDEHALLTSLGARIRSRRVDRALTVTALADSCQLSRRFLAEVEAGRANISVVRLHRLALALGTSAASLLEEPRARRIALLGLRGAGKSTVGALLAARLGVPFVELDQRVEDESGLPLAELFAVHGESYYRRQEAQALERLLASREAVVVATGGGLVNVRDTFDLLRRGCVTVWLEARPEEHLARVLAQGDQRPVEDSSDALAELRQILATRSPLYAESDLHVRTSDRTPVDVADEVLRRVPGFAA